MMIEVHNLTSERDFKFHIVDQARTAILQSYFSPSFSAVPTPKIINISFLACLKQMKYAKYG